MAVIYHPKGWCIFASNNKMSQKEEVIKSIVYNDDNIVNIIKEAPQTYNSILKHLKDDGTLQVVLRRRLKRLVKNQRIWKMRVPGTRFGLAIFCTPEHDYKILVSHGLGKTRIFFMYDFEENDKEVILHNYWELLGPNWSTWQYSSEPLKIPKYALRNGGFRLWE